MLSWVIRMQTVIRFTATDATALPHVESFELDGNIIAGEQGLHPLLSEFEKLINLGGIHVSLISRKTMFLMYNWT